MESQVTGRERQCPELKVSKILPGCVEWLLRQKLQEVECVWFSQPAPRGDIIHENQNGLQTSRGRVCGVWIMHPDPSADGTWSHIRVSLGNKMHS